MIKREDIKVGDFFYVPTGNILRKHRCAHIEEHDGFFFIYNRYDEDGRSGCRNNTCYLTKEEGERHVRSYQLAWVNRYVRQLAEIQESLDKSKAEMMKPVQFMDET